MAFLEPRRSGFSLTAQVALVAKNLPVNARDLRGRGSIPALGGSPGEVHGNPLQSSCLENPMDGRSWRVTVHGIAESDLTEALESESVNRSAVPDSLGPHGL